MSDPAPSYSKTRLGADQAAGAISLTRKRKRLVYGAAASYSPKQNLAAGITAAQTTITSNGTKVQTGDTIQVESEQMLVTAIVGATWTVDRGINGTGAKPLKTGFWVQGPLHDVPDAQRYGMDCETVAKTRLPEIARETVSGQLSTAVDWLIQPGQVHLVQGPAGEPDRLHTGEPLWCQGNDFDLEVQNGAPVMSQTPTYLGGGLPIRM